MFGVGMDFWSSSGPHPPAQSGTPSASCPETCPGGKFSIIYVQ